MNNVKMLRRKGQTKFIVPSLSGRLTIHDGGGLIAASGDHQGLLTRIDDEYISHARMENCTRKDIADVLVRISERVNSESVG